MFQVILNPYGIAYSMGLMAQGTPRANPNPLSLEDYLTLAQQVGARGVELFTPMLDSLDDTALHHLRDRLSNRGDRAVLSQPLWTGIGRSITCARALGISVIRMHMTSILCGDRAAPACKWPETVVAVKKMLQDAALAAAEHGLILAIEDHQDFTSAELMELCELAGDNVGICLDTGNPLSVGEDPVAFTRTVAPRVRHVHLKDYRAHWSDEGYRLIRCAIGDGAVPFAQIAQVLEPHGPLTAAIEPGALAARHIRLLTDDWWQGYAPRTHQSLAAALRAARVRRMDERDDWRTPWETDGTADQIVRYEMAQLHRSVANLKAMGFIN